MSHHSEAALTPRNGSELMVAVGCRISGCQNQKEASLTDQEDNAKEIIAEKYDGLANYRVISTIGKGEQLDRPELEEIEKAYRSRIYDVMVFDDLSRLIRGGDAARLLGVGVDHGTRTICIQDGIDTIDSTWEEDALNACSENVAHCERTSKRIKQKTMNRFKKAGATAKRPIMGYLVPEGAATFADWKKNETLETLILDGWRILKETSSGGRVADYLNANNVPRGPYARKKEWGSASALNYYRNPMLKGMPQRGNMATVKHHGRGKRVSRKNPAGPNYFPSPHLKFIEPEDFDAFHLKLSEKNKDYSRAAKSRQDVRSGVPRKRTRACGQHTRCWYCGRHFVWGANGIRDNLICSGVRDRHCWNSIAFSGPLATRRILEIIEGQLEHIEQLDEQFHQLVDAARNSGGSLAERWAKYRREKEILDRESKNITDAIAQLGLDDRLKAAWLAIKQRGTVLAGERHFLETAATRTLDLPTPAALRELMKAEFGRLPIDSLEFGDLFRQLVPQMFVYLVRLCDGGHLLPRAKVRLNLMGSIADAARVPGLEQLLSTEFMLDLFDTPAREGIRDTAVALTTQDFEQREIAALLPGKKWSQTEVWQALQLNKKMNELGLTTPYVVVHEPPADYPKLRRHKHPKYKFMPLEGYERPEL